MSANAAFRLNDRRENLGRINAAGVTLQLGITLAAVVVFNFFPDKIGCYRSALDPSSFIPLLGSGFSVYLPWLNAWWLGVCGLCLAHLMLKHWTPATCAIGAGLDLYGAALLGLMAAGTPFTEVLIVTPLLKSVLVLTGIGLLIGAYDKLRRLLQ